eukprot:jgi/Mesvir1/1543/Mv14526-RA.1
MTTAGFLARKRSEMVVVARDGSRRGALGSRVLRAAVYTVLPAKLSISYHFWGAPDGYLPWLEVIREADGTTRVVTARAFLRGSWLGLLSGAYAGTSTAPLTKVGKEIMDFSGEGLSFYEMRRGPDLSVVDYVNVWDFHSVGQVGGGLGFARTNRMPNGFVCDQGQVIATRDIQKGAEVWLSSRTEGVAADTHSVLAALAAGVPSTQKNILWRLRLEGFKARTVDSRGVHRDWEWVERKAGELGVVPRKSGWDSLRAVLPSGVTEVMVCRQQPAPLVKGPVPGLLALGFVIPDANLLGDFSTGEYAGYDWVSPDQFARDPADGARARVDPWPVAVEGRRTVDQSVTLASQ